jgi:hypothetical protein
LFEASSGRLRPVRVWLPALILILLGVGAVAIALNHLLVPSAEQHDTVAVLAGKDYADIQLSNFDRNPLLIRSHAVIGLLFVVLATFQFWPRFRSRNLRIHRLMGYAALACLVILPTTGVVATFVYPFAGVAAVLPNVVWMTAIVFCVSKAWNAIRRHDVIEHEAWITRATGMTLGITLSRLYEPLLVMGFHMDSRPALALVFWLGQGEGLIAAEFWLRRPGSPLKRRLARATARA